MRMVLLAAAVASGMAGAARAQEVVQWSAPPAAEHGQYSYFPMGTELRLMTRTELTTKDNHAGDRFYLEVAEPLIYHGQVVVPVGSVAVGEVMHAERNGYFGKKGDLAIRLLYVQTPSGPIRLSGHVARAGTGQGLLAIGGGVIVAWPMFFIHGTSGRLPAESSVTAYLADDLRFAVQADARPAVAAVPDGGGSPIRTLPARFDPSVFAASR